MCFYFLIVGKWNIELDQVTHLKFIEKQNSARYDHPMAAPLIEEPFTIQSDGGSLIGQGPHFNGLRPLKLSQFVQWKFIYRQDIDLETT